MREEILKQTEKVNELVCESCGQRFHYDHSRHCWKCDALTCPLCSSAENICPECRQKVLPESIEPMLARLGKLPVNSDNWSYEFKWDGIRAISYWNGQRLRIKSRNQLDITFRYPEFQDLGKHLQDNAIIDGEIIALDNCNRPSFSILQKRMHISRRNAMSLPKMRIFYYVFDILFLNGRDLMNQPYSQRRQILESLDLKHKFCRIPPSYKGNPNDIMEVAKESKLEGLICKKDNSIYQPGKRSEAWIKVKIIKSREFIIGGFKYSQTAANRIASLQMGAYDEDMALRFAGSVGTGFTDEDHKILLDLLEPITISRSPFADQTDKNVNFTKPINIVQVEYRRWPKNALVQQASFKGLRKDKHPSQIKLKEQ